MYKCGPWFGKLCCAILGMHLLLLRLLQWWRPAADIDVVPDYPAAHLRRKPHEHPDG